MLHWVSLMAFGLSCPMACEIIVPGSEIEPMSPCIRRWILNCWTTREVPSVLFKNDLLTVESLSLFFFFFNWKVIALQCSFGFCHTITGILCKCTYVPCLLSLLTPPPISPLEVSAEPGLSCWCYIAVSH